MSGLGRGAGTCLHNIYADILNDGVDLLSQKLGRYELDAVDPLCVLRREGRRGCHGIAAMRGNDLLVGFEAAVNTLCKSHTHTLTHSNNLNPKRQSCGWEVGNLRSARAVRAGNYQHPSRDHLEQNAQVCHMRDCQR